ncbi:hypothetical protein [Microbacterium capsulatum]|uniref:Uncharacterized protein n=1 Tax=Microbacterium capsulatum TaxID=3041921 RepID=A0ABU0XDU6_9MICO|nr:hypothetical protein [Microbacterium sp. ASV81]MDQ4213299.1 hypothetical protein [Microbacterium sp. ASV81]
MDPTPIPVQPFPVEPLSPDPGAVGGIAAGLLGFGILALLLYLGATFLVIWGVYWLIRLAVRHALMDAARWQSTGTVKKPKGYKAPPRDSFPVFRDRGRGPRDW